jgi:hydroxymethylpyrimidine/phosphomethylpyrimidine kinase
MSLRRRPRALTVAGSDSGGGAGIQADLLTFAALGVFGTSAVTAVTAQDTRGVSAVEPISAKLVTRQITVVLADVGADAVKTGMLCSGEIARAAAEALAAGRVKNLVVDPVMVSSSGRALLDRRGIEDLRDRLLPLARVVTPNLSEAAVLSGIEVEDLDGAVEAGRRILKLGPRSVVVTGGHLEGDPVDLLIESRSLRRFSGRRIAGGAHGTGCVFSAALTAHLAIGASLGDAVAGAKRLVEAALRRRFRLGRGQPLLGLSRRTFVVAREQARVSSSVP